MQNELDRIKCDILGERVVRWHRENLPLSLGRIFYCKGHENGSQFGFSYTFNPIATYVQIYLGVSDRETYLSLKFSIVQLEYIIEGNSS